MKTIQGKTIKVNGLDAHYYTGGQGEPLVVIHGGGGDARTWMSNIEELAGKYTVYAPDLPGYGGSQALAGDYYIPELSDFIGSFAGSLGLERFYLVGHSMGGGVALDYALKAPQNIKKLVLVSSLCLGREIAFWVRLLSIHAILRSLGTLTLSILQGIKWLAERLNPAEFIMPLSPASMTVGGNISTFRQQSLVLKDRLAEVAMPTLVVWGARDPIVPVKHAYQAGKAIPDCRVKVFEHKGHNVHRDALAEFSSTVRGFLG